MTRVKGKQYFEEKLPSLYRVPTVKHKDDKSFSLNNKSFDTEEEARAYLGTQIEQIGVFEITHVYGDRNAACANHFYTYRGFDITSFDRTADEIASGKKVQFLMVDIATDDEDNMFHGSRESLGLALDHIDAFLYKVARGTIKVKRSVKKHRELPENKRCAIIHTGSHGTDYLAWQKPAWDDSGYFWTSRKTFNKVLCNSTPEHPFLFRSKREACTWLRRSGIKRRCKITTIRINKSTKLNNPIMDGYAFPGMSADIDWI